MHTPGPYRSPEIRDVFQQRQPTAPRAIDGHGMNHRPCMMRIVVVCTPAHDHIDPNESYYVEKSTFSLNPIPFSPSVQVRKIRTLLTSKPEDSEYIISESDNVDFGIETAHGKWQDGRREHAHYWRSGRKFSSVSI